MIIKRGDHGRGPGTGGAQERQGVLFQAAAAEDKAVSRLGLIG